ncbi:DedA family protein [Aquibacillus rhizosphaerae]|uniref:DedA family protein n=1 Tax=Aquibacillus rhizosphaerae TaxID=3051431 RepID=A0ABT7LAR1_9BACI|nr:DedA family protein [Aquibacillus sp. LR5S19]MDL4842953.1 DedA family protein [Aquibacillus sp. LR5S19]
MENWLIGIINEYGYMGIMFLIAIENIFPPVPSEIILTFGGFMTTTSDLTIMGVVISSTAGSVIGAMILYGIGLQLDVNRLEKIIDRWGGLLRLTKQDIYKADSWFDKYGVWTVLICRFIPIIRSLISIPAGMSHMNLGLFLLFTTIGTLIWNVVLVNLGAKLGGSWDVIVSYMDIYSNTIYVIVFILFLLFIYKFIKKRK